MFKSLHVMFRNDDAQGLVEYGLILALVAIVAVVALKLLGGKVNNTLNNAASQLGP